MNHQQLFLIRRHMRIAGVDYVPGDVLDFAPLRLSASKMRVFQDQQKIEPVTSAEVVKVPDTAQALIESAAVAGGVAEPPVPDLPNMLGPPIPEVMPDPPAAADDPERVAELADLPKDDLLDMARAIGVAVRGSRLDVARRVFDVEQAVAS